MKKYILTVFSFFIATNTIANHIYHTQGVVKDVTGKVSSKTPVYNSTNSNSPNGASYIKKGTISGYTVGTYTSTSRKKTRKGTFAISTVTKSAIEDDSLNPLAQTKIAGATNNLIGFVRNPNYSSTNPTASPKNIALYEFTGTIPLT